MPGEEGCGGANEPLCFALKEIIAITVHLDNPTGITNGNVFFFPAAVSAGRMGYYMVSIQIINGILSPPQGELLFPLRRGLKQGNLPV